MREGRDRALRESESEHCWEGNLSLRPGLWSSLEWLSWRAAWSLSSLGTVPVLWIPRQTHFHCSVDSTGPPACGPSSRGSSGPVRNTSSLHLTPALSV